MIRNCYNLLYGVLFWQLIPHFAKISFFKLTKIHFLLGKNKMNIQVKFEVENKRQHRNSWRQIGITDISNNWTNPIGKMNSKKEKKKKLEELCGSISKCSSKYCFYNISQSNNNKKWGREEGGEGGHNQISKQNNKFINMAPCDRIHMY
jgi:hypothetical protein